MIKVTDANTGVPGTTPRRASRVRMASASIGSTF